MKKKMSVHDLSQTDILAADKQTLTDADTVILDPSLPQEQRAAYLLEQLKNLYFFRVGDIVVKLDFTNNGPSLYDALLSCLQRKKSGLPEPDTHHDSTTK